MGLLRGIKSRLFGGGAAIRLTVAAFGKHPGWSDHIEPGLGQISEEIAELKKRLYYVGIKKMIDSGSWRDLPEEDRLEDFDHDMVMTLSRGVIVGRMWSSTDARGRSEFPMVALAETEGLGVGVMCSRVLPMLTELERQVRQSRDEAAVRSAVDSAEASFNATMRNYNSLSLDRERSLNGILQRFFASPAFGEDGVGLLRILRVIERASSTKISNADRAVLQLRLPRTEGPVTDDLIDWSRLVRRCLRGVRPIIAVAPANERWVDLIAGPPADSEFFCLKARPTALAFDSDTPFEIDEAFKARWRSMAASA